MEHIAHIRQNDHEKQTVADHCRQTAELAARYGQDIGVAASAELAGWLHDVGKLTQEFNKYISGDSVIRRGDLDHSFAGAKYLIEKATILADNSQKKASKIIGRVILSHHGLNDWINEDAQNIFQKRISKEE